jgi:hypothetical protein
LDSVESLFTGHVDYCVEDFLGCIKIGERGRAVLCFFILVVVISFWMDCVREGTSFIPSMCMVYNMI